MRAKIIPEIIRKLAGFQNRKMWSRRALAGHLKCPAMSFHVHRRWTRATSPELDKAAARSYTSGTHGGEEGSHMSEDNTRRIERRPSWWPDLSHLPPGYAILWGITILSLIANLILLRQVAVAFQAARQAVYDAIAVIDELQATTISTTVHIDDAITL